MMTIKIPLSSEVEAKLVQRAAEAGEDVEHYAARLLDEVLRQPSLDALLAPVRQAFEQSGMSEDELSELLEREKHSMRIKHASRT